MVYGHSVFRNKIASIAGMAERFEHSAVVVRIGVAMNDGVNFEGPMAVSFSIYKEKDGYSTYSLIKVLDSLS